MSSIREEIRAILREELLALRADILPSVERVRIHSDNDLNHFVRDIIEKAKDPDFIRDVESGRIKYTLDQPETRTAYEMSDCPIVSSKQKDVCEILDKSLITERDISDLTSKQLRVAKKSRITPLAQDEIRRKGIRIERVET